MTMCYEDRNEGSVTIPVNDYNKLRNELAKKEEALVAMERGRSVRIDRYGYRYILPEDQGVSAIFDRMRDDQSEAISNLEYWRGRVNEHNKKPWWKRMAKIEVRR